jgi:hypothetical protein
MSLRIINDGTLEEHTFDVWVPVNSDNALTTLRTSNTSPLIQDGMGIYISERMTCEY